MPLERIPGYINWGITVKGTSLSPNDLIDVANNAEALGLKQPGGISRAHIRTARDSQAKDSALYKTLDRLERAFGSLDQNGNGLLEHGDIEGLVDANLAGIPASVKSTFGITRDAAIQQGKEILEGSFGIDPSKIPPPPARKVLEIAPGVYSDSTQQNDLAVKRAELEQARRREQETKDREADRLRLIKDPNYLVPRNESERRDRKALDLLRPTVG